MTLLATVLASCSSPPRQPDYTPLPDSTPSPSGALPPAYRAPTPGTSTHRVSNARTEREYRQDAAAHLYELNAHRIYRGKLQPMLYAIGTLQVHLDSRGQVTGLHWMRAPTHAPEVIQEIERTVRQAAPYPVATRLGRVVYTDTWLWDQSGKFQLDTLTEGQL